MSLTIAFALGTLAAPVTQDGFNADRQEAERTMQLFADCTVRNDKRRAEAKQFLRQIPGTKIFREEGRALVREECVPHSPGGLKMKFRPSLFRSSLYDALYRREFAETGAKNVADLAPLVIAEEFSGTETDIPKRFIYMRQVGDCVARRDPAGVHGLVLSKIGSDAEADAIARLTPVVSGCVAKDATLRFSRTVLRGVLAEGLYKLAVKASSANPAEAS